MTWPKFPKLRKEQNQWDNPEASTGIFIRFIGKDVCHEATGPAREIFDQKLGKEIKAILDGCGNPLQQTVTWSIYMIGRTRENTAPKVIFSCTDEAARKEVRKTIKDSGILRRYPGIGTGDSSLPPDFNALIQQLAIANIGCASEYGSVAKNAVLCTTSDITFGKQIFIKGYNGASQTLRRATAGGIVRFKDESYYLTVAHAFETRENIPSAKMEDCPFEIDFDGQSDADDGYGEDADVESTSRGSLTPEDARTEDGFSSDGGSDVSTQMGETARSHNPGIHVPDLPSANDRLIALTPRSTVTEQPPDAPTFLELVGDLALTSSDDPNSSLDVALIKLHDQNVYTVNEIPLGSRPGAPCLYSERIAKIELEDAEIVTVTASGGLLRGRLSATPTYMRLPHSKNFQKVYTVRLDGTIVDGDCGSLVVNHANGDLYGHIIAGGSGTGTAYIIPATQVFEDLEQRLGGAVGLPTRHSLSYLCQHDTLSSPIVSEISGPDNPSVGAQGYNKRDLAEPANRDSPVSNNKGSATIYICVACNRLCRSKSSLSRHQTQYCEREVEWFCSFCVPNKRFYRKDKLSQHHINNHGRGCVAGCKQQQGGLCKRHLSHSTVPAWPKKAWGCPCCVQCFDTLAAWTTHSASHLDQNGIVVGWSLSTMIQSLLSQPYIKEVAAELPWQICDLAKVNTKVCLGLREVLERHQLCRAVHDHYDFRHLQLPEKLAHYAFRLLANGDTSADPGPAEDGCERQVDSDDNLWNKDFDLEVWNKDFDIEVWNKDFDLEGESLKDISLPIVASRQRPPTSSSPIPPSVFSHYLGTSHDGKSVQGIPRELPYDQTALPFGEGGHQERRCPHPDCGRVFEDLKKHLLMHQPGHSLKFPIPTCENHTNEAHKCDTNRHNLTMNSYDSLDSIPPLPYSLYENPSFYFDTPPENFQSEMYRSASLNGSLKPSSHHSSEFPPSTLSSASGHSISSASSYAVGPPYSGHAHTFSHQEAAPPTLIPPYVEAVVANPAPPSPAFAATPSSPTSHDHQHDGIRLSTYVREYERGHHQPLVLETGPFKK